MIGPRHMGSSPTLKRQLSRLSSSSSFQVRQSNARIYTFLVAGGFILLATVALLQFNLQGAPRSSKLSPRETGQSGEGTVPNQYGGVGGERARQKSKGGRGAGSVQVDEDGDEESRSEDDEMDLEDDPDSDEEEFFDIDDRMFDEEEPEEEDAEPSNGEDGSAKMNSTTGAGFVKSKNESSVVVDHGVVRHENGEVVEGNAIPDWVLDIKVGSREQEGRGGVDTLQSLERDLVKGVEEKKRGSFYWDHGIKKRALENVEPVSAEREEEGKGAELVGGGERGAAKVALQHLKGFKDIVESWKERFNSDDELVDEKVQQRMEGVREIEDALLLNGDGAANSAAADKAPSTSVLLSSRKFGAVLKKGPRGSFDGVNPTSNPMLQDPDTPPGTWMTKTDKDMLRAIRGESFSGAQKQQPPKALVRGNIVSMDDSAVHRQASSR